MAARQLSAAVALGLVAGLGVGLAVGRVGGDDNVQPTAAAATVPDGHVGYALAVQDLRATLAAYGALAQSIVDHEQVHALVAALERHESALAEVAARARVIDTDQGAALAALAEHARQRAAAVRELAWPEDTALEGVLAMQALGREVGSRAARLGSALDAATTGGSWAEVTAEVERPWPPEGAEGGDTPVG